MVKVVAHIEKLKEVLWIKFLEIILSWVSRLVLALCSGCLKACFDLHGP